MKTLKVLKKYLKPCYLSLIFSFIMVFISVALTLYIPILIGKAIDQMIGKNNVLFDKIGTYLIIIAILLVLASLFNYFYELIFSKMTQKIVLNLRNDVFKKLQNASISYIDSHPHGDLVSREVSDIEQVSTGLLEGFKQFYKGLITILITLGLMLYVHYLLALVVVIITPLSLFIAAFISKKTHHYFKKQAKIKGEISSYVLEIIENQKEVKGLCYEDDAIKTFKEYNHNLYEVGKNAQFASSTTNPCTRFVNNLVYAAVGIVGAILMIHKKSFIPILTIGGLSSFLTYANQYTKPFNEISGVVTELQSALSSLKRIEEILNIDSEIDNGNQNLSHPIDKICFDKVYFSYNDKPLIENFNLVVRKGKKIAIVGPTGCGKTTMINLLMRFYDVKSGGIYLNDININDIKKDDLRKSFGMVLQDTWLFKGTIFENVAYSKPNATKEEVIEACKKVHAHSFIKRLPQGYDTVISQNSGLSQGEKQLLTIARIMLLLPEIIIRDEATSNIDTRTEIKINKAFDEILNGRTSFVIAHRLSTIRSADLILVMNNGNIIETGTHESLLNQDGFYKKLYYSQFETGNLTSD